MLSLLISCTGETKTGYEIKGSLSGEVADGTQVFLRKSDENMRPVPGDTVKVTKGSFEFTGNAPTPELRYIFVEGIGTGIPVIVENGSIRVSAHRDSLSSAEVTGTPQNEAYADFVEGTRKLVVRRNAINNEMQAAMQSRDSANMNALRDEFFELQETAVDYEKTFVENHPEARISAMLVNRMVRAEDPNSVKVYKEYKDKGLSILGVSLDRKADDWINAIEQDGLTWHHVSNVRYFDEIAELYNVRAIPASFILDENGVIVAKNLRGSALEAKIAELLP